MYWQFGRLTQSYIAENKSCDKTMRKTSKLNTCTVVVSIVERVCKTREEEEEEENTITFRLKCIVIG